MDCYKNNFYSYTNPYFEAFQFDNKLNSNYESLFGRFYNYLFGSGASSSRAESSSMVGLSLLPENKAKNDSDTAGYYSVS